ncbi:MAG: hypothetical protein OER88_13460, partial [Planctomycetota bacterium]|nr:hypothetical protein [Planctomycetota bacterium]
MLGVDGPPRAMRVAAAPTEPAGSTRFGTLNFVGVGSVRLFAEDRHFASDATESEAVVVHPEFVRITLRIQYANGEHPRGFLLTREHAGRKVSSIVGRNDDRSGVFELDLEPGSHRVRWMSDHLSIHRGDPIVLGTATWTIDTQDRR